MRAGSVQTELISLRILHHYKACLHTPVGVDPADPRGAQAPQTGGLGVERGHPGVALGTGGGADVQVQPVLGDFALRHPLKEHPRAGLTLGRQRSRAAVVFVRSDSPGVESHLPAVETRRWWLHSIAEHVAPELSQLGRIGTVERDLDFASAHGTKANERRL